MTLDTRPPLAQPRAARAVTLKRNDTETVRVVLPTSSDSLQLFTFGPHSTTVSSVAPLPSVLQLAVFGPLVAISQCVFRSPYSTIHTPTRPHLYFGHLFRVNTSLQAVTRLRMMRFVGLFTLHAPTHIRYTLVVLPCVSSSFLIIGSGHGVMHSTAPPYKASAVAGHSYCL